MIINYEYYCVLFESEWQMIMFWCNLVKILVDDKQEVWHIYLIWKLTTVKTNNYEQIH